MSKTVQTSVVIVAGGKGSRVGAEMPKQFLSIAHKPMLMHTIEQFYATSSAMQIVVVLPQEHLNLWQQLCKEHKFHIPHRITTGGSTRFESVKNGLTLIDDNALVAIHDGARPLVSKELINRCFNLCHKKQQGVIPVVDEKNSLRLVSHHTHQPLNREHVKIVQTPQVFPAQLLKEAYRTPYTSHFTDDATVAEAHGITIHLTQGEDTNIKVTTPLDLEIASLLLTNDK